MAEIMAQRRGDPKGDIGVFLGGLGSECGDVSSPVPSWQQEIGVDHDQFRASLDAAIISGGDRWLGQLHVRRFDDRIAAVLLEQSRDAQQHVIALGAARAVIHDDHADLVAGRGGERNGHEARPPNNGVDR
jgi:hypothetical protein